MRTILIANPKGGCGKSTLATNLSSYYALWKVSVALVDYDPQLSSIEWLEQRNEGNEEPGLIHGIDASGGKRSRASVPSGTKRVIIDSPARTPLSQLKRLFGFADRVIVPVLPSPMDIRAAGHFIGELMFEDLIRTTRVGIVANRVRENTRIYSNLEQFLGKMKIPVVTHLRDAQNYIRSAESGYGVFEMAPYQADRDIEQWRPLIKWIEKA